MNNISSLTEQTITLVPSAEFCIPVLSFVLCLLHCTVPALFLSGQICSFPQLPVSGNQGRWEEEGKHIFYGNAQTHQTTHRQVREHGAQCINNVSRKVTFFALVVLHSSLCTPYMVPVVGYFCT